ncbi:MAG: hypothetical protein AAFR75_04935 [Pseudomonadota bacterium]
MHKALSKYLFYLPATYLRGEHVLGLLPEKRENAYLSPDALASYQTQRLRSMLQTAAAHSTHYADLPVASMPSNESKNSEFFDWFKTVPYLTKQDLINYPNTLRTKINRRVSSKTTGGSTGEPVRLWKNADALAHERSATWRAYQWANVSIGDPQLRFWGIPLAQSDQRAARVIDLIANRRRISAFDLTEAAMAGHYETMVNFRPAYLYGYASVIYALAEFIGNQGLPIPKSLRSIITTSEVLSENARNVIESTFSLRVFNEYGCGEVGSIAHECSEGRMHVMADNVYLEIDSSDGGVGEIIVTDLHNTEMPIIRYRLGDFASWSSETCPCGVSLPTLRGIYGRAYDTVVTTDGRRMHPESVMYIFESLQTKTKAFRHFQAVQKAADRFEVLVVPTDSWSKDTELSLKAMICEHISNDISTDIRIVDSIKREKSGKIRVVKSEVSG